MSFPPEVAKLPIRTRSRTRADRSAKTVTDLAPGCVTGSDPARDLRPAGVSAYKEAMNRRQFLKTGSAAAISLSSWPAFAAPFAQQTKRVGLIGTGWYGK